MLGVQMRLQYANRVTAPVGAAVNSQGLLAPGTERPDGSRPTPTPWDLERPDGRTLYPGPVRGRV